MSLMELTSQNFDAVIEKYPLILVDFWASWCRPCMDFAATYEKTATEFPDIVFGKVNVEQETDLTSDFQIRTIPTILVIKDGVVVFSEAGNIPHAVLKDLIEQAKTLDVKSLTEGDMTKED